MPKKELQDIGKKATSAKNLKNALIAIGYFILAGLTEFLMIDLFYPGPKKMLIWFLACLYLILFIISGIYALKTMINAIVSLGNNKNIRNYIAMFISGLVLLGLCFVILDVLL